MILLTITPHTILKQILHPSASLLLQNYHILLACDLLLIVAFSGLSTEHVSETFHIILGREEEVTGQESPCSRSHQHGACGWKNAFDAPFQGADYSIGFEFDPHPLDPHLCAFVLCPSTFLWGRLIWGALGIGEQRRMSPTALTLNSKCAHGPKKQAQRGQIPLLCRGIMKEHHRCPYQNFWMKSMIYSCSFSFFLEKGNGRGYLLNATIVHLLRLN